jgi:hypothetical protein
MRFSSIRGLAAYVAIADWGGGRENPCMSSRKVDLPKKVRRSKGFSVISSDELQLFAAHFLLE